MHHLYLSLLEEVIFFSSCIAHMISARLVWSILVWSSLVWFGLSPYAWLASLSLGFLSIVTFPLMFFIRSIASFHIYKSSSST